MIRGSYLFLAAVLVLAFAVLAAACGDDDAPSQTAGAASPSATDAGASPGATLFPSNFAQDSPTPTEAPAGTACTATASVNDPTPAQHFKESVTGILTCADGGAEGATMHTVWHERTANKSCDARADATGSATCGRTISLTPGYRVDIDVIFTAGGFSYTTTTSFTPAGTLPPIPTVS